MAQKDAFLGLLALYLYSLTQIGCGLKWLIFIVTWLSTGGTRWCYLFYHTWRRDLSLLVRGLTFLKAITIAKYKDQNVIQIFRNVVEEHPQRVMLINAADDKKWTYTQIEEYSNRVANYFLKEGFHKGDAVALFMENRPEYIGIWLGLAKVGVVPAFINYNLRNESLMHTIKAASCKAIIYGLELEDGVKEVFDKLNDDFSKADYNSQGRPFLAFYSKASDAPASAKTNFDAAVDLDRALKSSSSDREPAHFEKTIRATDRLLYIYTSGTTGLPKAVTIKHIRQLFACLAIKYTIGLIEGDVIYCHLPLYHSSGGQVGTAAAIFGGTTTVIKKKFSASNFWKDCIKYEVTATQYIGEICRYLLSRPPSPEETLHKVRLMFGNGLRSQIWPTFVQRFNIKDIAEFYGATEGNSNILNIDNKVGAVGFTSVTVPAFIQEKLLPLSIIQVDRETGEPIRGPDGLCKQAAPGEQGEFIGKIVRGDPVKDFEGYKDKEATKKKILTNVYKKGDLYFRSGDIFIMDEFGWLYFQDRAGDTFRWKGENVATTEVEATISNILELKDATSYGVRVPNSDGRAGMVAIPAKDQTEVDLEKLYSGLVEKLPAYARPLFVRLVKELPLTGTYKLKKTVLQDEGFDLSKTGPDPVFFLDARAGKYVALDQDILAGIESGKIRL